MATDQIDMSLDDYIKKNKIRPGGRGRGGRGGAGGTKSFRGGTGAKAAAAAMNSPRGNRGGFRGGRGGARFGQRGAARGGVARGVARGGVQKRAPAYKQQAYIQPVRGQGDGSWKQSQFAAGGAVTDRREGKLLISNLESGVTDSDINELFTEFGTLHKAAVHYDRTGRSLGTAEVIFARRLDGMKALKQYNDVPLDGRPMKIQLVGDTLAQQPAPVRPVSAPAQTYTPRGGRGNVKRGGFANRGGSFRGASSSFRGAAFKGNRGGFRGGRGGRGARGGRGGKVVKELTKDQLDAQLDAYNSKMDMS